ncbi:MAG: shikimate kinase [Bacteroidales bacterium]|nr:shikimate kinase [Bacteroidales bacterium]
MKIFLIGFMYCGKTTVGKKISKLLGYPLIDTDKYIEEKLGKSVEDIFKDKGEEFFRQQETLCLYDIKKEEDIVVSTGGGLPCYNDNISLIKSMGKSLYLEMTPSQILSRAEKSHKSRPLMQSMNKEEKLLYIEKTLKEREQYYNQADIRINAFSLTNFELEITIEELLRTNRNVSY